jgi:cysteine-rich repeat protein
MDAAVHDAKDARADLGGPDASAPRDGAGGNDAPPSVDAGGADADAVVLLETCAEVRQCARASGGTGAVCLRGASATARASSEPLLACEGDACAAPCRNAYALGACNACLLLACPAAFVGCARQSGCGDGVLATDTEECDDGNVEDRDSCTAACTRARCGDGRVHDGQEACDDGNRIDTDACLTSCRRAVCGDGIVWTGVEGCDDGNQSGGDGCSAVCLIESCGNAVLDPGEECDEGASNRDEAPCLPTCRANRCGDGKTCRGDGCGARLGTDVEQCDDGNDSSSDACVKGCRSAVCGDGYVRDGAETCDDGNDDAFDRCGDCVPAAGHLLITEIVTRPTGAEFIEIFNPTLFSVALSDFLLSDSHLYYEVASGTFTTASGSDFAARFPEGAELEPGGYAVVALGNASGGSQSFAAAYGKTPDYELRPTANQATDDPAVANMVPVGSSSIGASASLTDGGEPVVLFSYRGGDLVSDVDYLFYGTASVSNAMVDKSGVAMGASTYLPDTPVTAQHAMAAPGEAGSLHRCVYGEAHETAVQGNGIGGHDETSEDVTAAFALATTTSGRTPGAPPPAGICP